METRDTLSSSRSLFWNGRVLVGVCSQVQLADGTTVTHAQNEGHWGKQVTESLPTSETSCSTAVTLCPIGAGGRIQNILHITLHVVKGP